VIPDNLSCVSWGNHILRFMRKPAYIFSKDVVPALTGRV